MKNVNNRRSFVVTLILLISTFISGYSQGEFSRKFDHDGADKDVWTNPDLTSQDVIMTTFIKDKVYYLIDTPGIKFIKIGIIELGENIEYFTMSAIGENGKVLKAICGDYPCPDQCIPPAALIPHDNTFLKSDIEEILQYSPHISFINVQLADRAISGGLKKTTLGIYGLIGNYVPGSGFPTPVSLRTKDHPVFISIHTVE